MGTVATSASMSLDGFIAGPAESGFEHLFAWHRNGDVDVPSADPRWSYRLTEASAQHLRTQLAQAGALVVGRRLYDVARGWGGQHPLGVPVFVVTHRDPDAPPHPGAPFTFVTDGVESAIMQAATVAGGKRVVVAAGDIARQALAAGLLDEIHVDLVPLLLGSGTRLLQVPDGSPVRLEPMQVVESAGVTHLSYRVVGDVG